MTKVNIPFGKKQSYQVSQYNFDPIFFRNKCSIQVGKFYILNILKNHLITKSHVEVCHHIWEAHIMYAELTYLKKKKAPGIFFLLL